MRTAAVSVLILAVLWVPPAATARQQTVSRIGVLSLSASSDPSVDAFQAGLREFGWHEGRNIAFEYRYADGKLDRLAGLAVELVGLKVDIIFTLGDASIRAAKQATRTIPIVAIAGDFVESGHAASLARPGGNVAGVSDSAQELSAKRLELLKEMLPKAERVAVLWTATNPAKALDIRQMRIAARTLRLALQSLEVRGPEDFQGAVAAAIRERADAMVVLQDALTIAYARRIVDLAARNRLPAMYGFMTFAEAGGLMTYGYKPGELERRAAALADKILRGAHAGDLPIDQPMSLKLVVNMKAARALGLTIPQSILLRADEVIE